MMLIWYNLTKDVTDAVTANLSIFFFSSFKINGLSLTLDFFYFFSIVSMQHNCLMVPFAGWCGSRIPYNMLLCCKIVDCDG
jgi:hypothetical protein